MKDKIPTLDEYLKARKITDAYEGEQKRLYLLKVENARVLLNKYFEQTLVAGRKIKHYALNESMGTYQIIPTPDIDGCYEGENDEDIGKIAEQAGIKLRFVHWMYSK